MDSRVYETVTAIGHGGMAEVYLAVARGPLGFQKLVVIKRLRASLASDRSFRRMFIDEARLAGRLSHPNIVQTYEVGEDAESYFIAMEYLDGQPLNQLVREAMAGRLSLEPPMAARIASDALAALDYAHRFVDVDGKPLGIVHRDVSPHNVFVTYDGRVVLVDFGIAKAAARLSEETEVGIVKGKRSYMAPEQAIGGVVDLRTDIYAMGVVLWEMLSRRRMYAAREETVREKASGPGRESIPPLGKYTDGIDPELQRIVETALQPERDARFATAGEMREALEAYLARCEPRPRLEKLGARMADVFGEVREERRRLIQPHLRSLEANADASWANLPGVPAAAAGDIAGSEGRVSAAPQSSAATSAMPGPAGGHGSAPPAGHAEISESAPARRDSITTLPRQRTDAPPASTGTRVLRAAMLVAGAVVVLGGAAWLARPAWLGRAGGGGAGAGGEGEGARGVAGDGGANATGSAPSAAAAAAAASPTLRVCGSWSMGTELAPSLTDAFFRKKGATQLTVIGRDGRFAVVGAMPGAAAPEAIAVDGVSTASGFEALAAGTCDVALASRRIHEDEANMLGAKGFGDMRSPGNEHQIGVEGIAVIVHPNNPVHSLELGQLADAFSGKITTWSGLGGGPQPIAVCARDDVSATYDTFKQLVLHDAKLAPGAHRYQTNDEIADAVAGDVGALGFVGLSHVRTAKPIAVAAGEASPVYPSPFTVATQEYPLTRSLYLYTAERPARPLATDYVAFALSPDGQQIVTARGYVDLGIRTRGPEPCRGACPRGYEAAVAHAERLSVTFRFASGSVDLDSRAFLDLDRVVKHLSELPERRDVVLLGFSDASEAAAEKATHLSHERGTKVADELASRGVRATRVVGFGAQVPIASTTSEEGREKNRRVEIWLQPPKR